MDEKLKERRLAIKLAAAIKLLEDARFRRQFIAALLNGRVTINYETRYDMIVTRAWEQWTRNGLNLDAEDRDETTRIVQDAVNNTYVDGIDDKNWLDATMRRLRS